MGSDPLPPYDTIKRAASNGWERVGHHVIRQCKVSECGQTGIHSSLGAAFSVIEDCEIFHCNRQKPFFGCDQAGLKLLCSVDVTIRGNRIHHNGGWAGIWLDWMAQGTRVAGNRLWANTRDPPACHPPPSRARVPRRGLRAERRGVGIFRKTELTIEPVANPLLLHDLWMRPLPKKSPLERGFVI